MSDKNHQVEWWQEEYGFFGNHYIEGDDSQEGYLDKRKQNLEQRTETEVRGIIKLLDLQPSQRVLDIPCGYGRHSLGLARQGMGVVGIDLNNVHLEKAKQDARQAGVSVELHKADMIDIAFDQEFDAVVNMFYSFGFFEKDEENFKVLRNFYQALKEGGQFLFHTDVNIPRIIKGKYKQDEIRHLSSGNTLRIVDKYDPVTKRINGSWSIIQPGGAENKKDYSVRVYTKDEFTDLCRQAGFKEFLAYSDWDGTAYDENSEDMIIIAKK